MRTECVKGNGGYSERQLVDLGHDAERFTEELNDKGIEPCIAGRKSRRKSVNDDQSTNTARGPGSCSGVFRTGAGLSPVTTHAPVSSSPPSPPQDRINWI